MKKKKKKKKNLNVNYGLCSRLNFLLPSPPRHICTYVLAGQARDGGEQNRKKESEVKESDPWLIGVKVAKICILDHSQSSHKQTNQKPENSLGVIAKTI
jgi:hypothetical protein